MDAEAVRIGPVESPERYWELMDVMKDAWNMPDYTEAVPPHLLRAIADNGGVVLAAYLPSGEIVGFVFGIPAIDEKGRVYHYSHMVGVKRAYWGKSIALKLKLAQRDAVLSQGLDLIKWTYDPHQGLNARFNFYKLGVICNTFYENYYGVMKDGINRGLLSDRFKVEWWIKSPRVEKRISGELKPPSYEEVSEVAEFATETAVVDGVRRVVSVDTGLRSDLVLVEISPDINKAKEISLELANEWKLKLRPVFKEYFKRGYVAIEFITVRTDGGRRNFYLLWRGSKEKILAGEQPWK